MPALHRRQRRARPTARKLAAIGFGMVALGCAGILAVLFRFCGSVAVFASLFASGSPARSTVIYQATCLLFAVVGVGILLSSAVLSAAHRWTTWALCLLLAVLSVPLASAILPIWLIPLWLIFRYAASTEP